MTSSRDISKLRPAGHKRSIFFHILSTLTFTFIMIAIIFSTAIRLNTQVEMQMLERYQQEQLISVFHQSAMLGDALKSITHSLEMLSTHEELIHYQEQKARTLLKTYYENNQPFVIAGYRMDHNGILKYVEGQDKNGEGFDISSQSHVNTLFKTQKNVISGSFKAVEGYYAVAIHVPVFKNNRIDGSIATLVNWDGFRDRFAGARDGSNSFTMLLDKAHKIILHPRQEYIGQTIEDSPLIEQNGEPLPASFLYAKNTGILGGPFFDHQKHVIASHPFTFEGVTYSLVNCAPYEDILGPIHQTSRLTAMLAGFSLFIIIISLSYFFYGFWRVHKNLLKYQEDVDKEAKVRERIEHNLNETQDSFLTVLNSIDATIFVADLKDHTILFMNQFMEKSFNTVNWKGKKCHEVFKEKDSPCPHCTNPELIDENGDSTGVHVWEAENPVIKKWFHNFDRAIKWIDGRMVKIQIATDITSLKTYEAQQREMAEKLQRAQKMEAIGTLAGGVAHDLNNILSGIVTYPELLLMDLPEDSPLVEPLLSIHNSGLKAAEIVSDLLTLGRRGVSISELVNFNNIITEYLDSPEYAKLRSYHPTIRIESRLDAALLNIKGSPIHLRKTLMNLVSNAVEAHISEGKVTITTRNQYVDTPLPGYRNVIEGEYAVVEISDQGMGISREDINRVFEPFYTKKVMGRSGTGLGMAVVWGTVQDHEGYIDILSSATAGTTFTLYFPISMDHTILAEKPFSMDTCKGNGEKILIIDDVEEQRQIAGITLEKLGYQTVCVKSGEAAIQYLKEN
ncbi:MAG: hypothetical protein KKH99_04645, partial [Proteobacteria bacterium]|nr:hypothetical protein [Pseudomonadota bacterium]